MNQQPITLEVTDEQLRGIFNALAVAAQHRPEWGEHMLDITVALSAQTRGHYRRPAGVQRVEDAAIAAVRDGV